jgi:hypothetical protein
MIRLSYENFVCAIARGRKLRWRFAKIGQPGSPQEVVHETRPTRAFNQRPVKGDVVHELTAERRSSSHNDSWGRTVAVR